MKININSIKMNKLIKREIESLKIIKNKNTSIIIKTIIIMIKMINNNGYNVNHSLRNRM